MIIRKGVTVSATGAVQWADDGPEGPITVSKGGTGVYTLNLPVPALSANSIAVVVCPRHVDAIPGFSTVVFASVGNITASAVGIFTGFDSSSYLDWGFTAEVVYEI